ncbi:MAG: copper amine oxidase N-terminal domain-containing protein [Fimbriimonadales bacterium]
MPYTINGLEQTIPNPQMKDGTTFVPLADVSDTLGGYVDFDHESKTANVELGAKKAKVTANDISVESGGATISLQAAPYIENDTMWVPVRFFQHVFDCELNVDGDNVSIKRPL